MREKTIKKTLGILAATHAMTIFFIGVGVFICLLSNTYNHTLFVVIKLSVLALAIQFVLILLKIKKLNPKHFVPFYVGNNFLDE